ncbi:epoxide hydrolase family protein [uncultured Algimonas sp.]|uniref:epoxide hydrolase family protein n=1 Tax=uncultured Algimonas sp. TaxID=1547920 RepID=UPI0026018FAA|nr:epoxide hydrolase family protein [uncultured Algimonas sp.]
MTSNADAFTIDIASDIIDDLRARLSQTRFPDTVAGAGWDYGTKTDYLETLIDYWRNGYDWEAEQDRLNGFDHFKARVDGLDVHFVHATSSRDDAIPLLLLHGWPSSFVQMLDLIPQLTEGEPAFHVVAASLPGFGFSDRPSEPGMSPAAMAPMMHALMHDVLGYERYGMRSSDLGAGVASAMALSHPEAVIGSHTGGTNPYLQGEIPTDLSEAEAEFVANAQNWMQTEMAYAQLHASKPQTLAVALNDSPAGLASWIVEKFHKWVDHDGDPMSRVGRDAFLTNLTIYWATQTIGSSMRLYYEAVRSPGSWGRADVPVGYLMPRHDMFPTPREWMERQGPIGHWTETDQGGHFMEWEQPGIVADDLQRFFGAL